MARGDAAAASSDAEAADAAANGPGSAADEGADEKPRGTENLQQYGSAQTDDGSARRKAAAQLREDGWDIHRSGRVAGVDTFVVGRAGDGRKQVTVDADGELHFSDDITV